MKWSLFRLLMTLALVAVVVCSVSAQQTSEDTVVRWNNIAMESARSNNARGLLTVRALAIMYTAMFDAWAQYDAVAIPALG